MSRFRRLLWMALLGGVPLLALCPPAPVRAEEDPPVAPAPEPTAPEADPALRERVVAWLKDLSSDEFKVREAARVGLKREGLEARDLLEAASHSDDPEVRRTVSAILKGAPGAQRAAAGDVRSGDFDALGHVSLDLKEEPLPAALATLGKLVGAHFALPKGHRADPVTLELEQVPCYEALGALLARGELRLPEPVDRHGTAKLVPAADAGPRPPSGVAGPMRVVVQEVAATRVFGKDAAPRYAIKLRLEWAPYVQVVSLRTPRVEVARDPDGKTYKESPSVNRNSYFGLSSRATSTTVDLLLIPGDVDCKPALKALEFSLEMTLRFDRAELVLPDTEKIPAAIGVDGEPAGRGQDESVTFLSLEESAQGRGQWVLDYAAVLTEEVAQRTLQGFVREEDGSLTQLYVGGGRSRGADGTVRMTARAYRGTKGKPKAIVVTWHRREERGTLRFRLEDIPLR